MLMKILTSTAAQKDFGTVMRTVPREPVFLTQHSKLHAVVISIEDLTDLLEGNLARLAEKSGSFLSVEASESALNRFAAHA